MLDNMTKASHRRELFAMHNAPSRSSLDRYHGKATMLDNCISLVWTAFSMKKTSRRQMASTSFRNLMSHICAVAYSNFSPCATRWEHFYKVSLGAQELMEIIQSVTGQTNCILGILHQNIITTIILWQQEYMTQHNK